MPTRLFLADALHAMLVCRLCCSTLNIEGRSEMRQVRKGNKSEREAISRVEKSITKQYANRADPSSITEVTRF